ncbi:MAG TPA: ABC transporter substrate-binding protein, partial [Pseudolabrys sp.]
VPQARRIAYLASPSNSPVFEEQTSEIRQAAHALGREIIVVEGRSDFDFEVAFDTIVQRGAGALVVGNTPWAVERRHMILTLAARHKVPAMYPFSTFVFEGGLMSYGVGRGVFRQVASHYVGKILKGAKPNDLPIQQPTKFELVINLKTARALGIDVPEKLLALADEVIE